MGADKSAENTRKIPQMPQNLFAKIVCPSSKVWDFDDKRLHWASIVRVVTKGKTGKIGALRFSQN